MEGMKELLDVLITALREKFPVREESRFWHKCPRCLEVWIGDGTETTRVCPECRVIGESSNDTLRNLVSRQKVKKSLIELS